MKSATEKPFLHLSGFESPVNWFGQKAHETDALIHWTERDKVGKANELRDAFELIKSVGLEKELDILLKAAIHHTECEAADLAAGESI